MARNIAVGIDIGTYQIKIVVVEGLTEENKTVYKIIGTGYAESKGLRHGYIINAGDTIKSLQVALNEAERSSGVKIKRAFLSVGGIGLGSIMSQGSIIIPRADSEITELDIKNVLSVAESEIPTNISINKKIIHTIPVSY